MTVAASYIVVAFHRPDSLAALLRAAADDEIERIVVNVEADPHVRRVAEDAGALVLDVLGNVGYAAAVNHGVVAACGEVVLFSNDDLLVGAAEVLALASVVSGERVSVAVPMIVDGSGNHELSIAPLPTVGALAREWMLLPDRPVAIIGSRVSIEKWKAPAAPAVVDAATAAIVAVRRYLIVDEPMPEDYFLYWEESEWFWRLHERGVVVEYRPDIVVRHLGGRDDVRAEKSRLLARNAVRCIRRTQGRTQAALAVPVVILWNLRLWLVAVVRRRHVAARWAGLGAACASVREVWR